MTFDNGFHHRQDDSALRGAIEDENHLNRVNQLKIEIAKATHPEVKWELEQMLAQELEAHAQRKQSSAIVAVIGVVVFIVIALIMFAVFTRSTSFMGF